MDEYDIFDYLKTNEIKDHPCDLQHTFAFLSYSHEEKDAQKVREVFEELTKMGYNIWIDIANIPNNAEHWKSSAMSALNSANCGMIIFFRSESSLKRQTILDELNKFSARRNDIVAVDIYSNGSNTENIRQYIKDSESDDINTVCDNICGIVDTECSAIRLHQDCQDNINTLAKRIETQLINHGIKQHFSLTDRIPYILDGTFNISLQGDQVKVYNIFIKMLNKTFGKNGDGKKRTLIVEGNPGTGKTALIMYLISYLRKKKIDSINCIRIVTKNEAPRQVYKHTFHKKKEAREDFQTIFRGQGQLLNEQNNRKNLRICDVMFLDEAHRLVKSFPRIPKTDFNHAQRMFCAGLCTIAFVDEKQRVTVSDCGTKENLLTWAEASGAEEIFFTQMKSQLRCSETDSYYSWVDAVLNNRHVESYIAKTSEYDIRVFDDPNEMYDLIAEKNYSEGFSRLVAGYCWEWNESTKSDVSYCDIKIPDKNFEISWNIDSTSPFASRCDISDEYNPFTKHPSEDEKKRIAKHNSILEAGCIHTIQGLEFCYAGVIIGEDLYLKDGKIETDASKRATTDYSMNGIKNMPNGPEIADTVIRNTYSVLLTRGIKGCYIYCVNKELNEYMKKMVKRYNDSYKMP